MTTETQQLKILTRARSPFNDIFVIERENLREMWFQGNGRFYLQTRIDLDRPGELALIYTRLLLAPLMWNPDPSRILMIGLGGGVLPRFLNGLYPDIGIDVVEVDLRVTELARRYFSFQESPRLRVLEDDGRAFVKQCGQKYDMVFLDAFKGGSVPYHLKTVEFYREIARSLKEDGILVTNLYGKSNALKPRDRKTLEAVFQRVLFFEDAEHVATVCVAILKDEGVALETLRRLISNLPEKVQRNLSWLENTDMIESGSPVEPNGSVFKDDFEASEFFKAVKRNNRDDPFFKHPYPIRNSS
ncbi:MAG: fused MFS/spermidine synthase [Nitrospinota bacterium]|nr:fused MFS/spermidine synthase [Nitrospinota bacterium]